MTINQKIWGGAGEMEHGVQLLSLALNFDFGI
jgi:hypothetical protein